jgi:hypothetical protein
MRWWVFACVIVAAACDPLPAPAPTPLPTPEMNTSWGIPSALTWATTFDPPALFTDGNEIVTAAFELYDDTPTLTIYRDGVRMRSNIAARQPYELTVFPSTARGTLALWLDDDGAGIQKLFVARLNDAGFSERGSVAISSGAVTRYSAAVMPDGGLWTVWSTPNAGESTLIGSRLDAEGRARSPQPLRVDADYPALAVTNAGNALLFWLEGDRRDLYRGELTQSGLTLTTTLVAPPLPFAAADHLIALKAGVDNTHAYIFWQTLAASGANEAWYTSGKLLETAMRSARRLRIGPAEAAVQTGFNHGVAFAVVPDDGEVVVGWASPASGQNESLPVATFTDDTLGVLYFRDGEVFAAQSIGTLPRSLIAPPHIAVDDERDLALAWWLPDTRQEAVLYLVESRR